MIDYVIINDQNNFLHNVVCVITRSFLKHTDLNITEFLPKTIFSITARTHLIKKQIIKYGNILLGVHFNLRYSKLKSDY